MRYNT